MITTNIRSHGFLIGILAVSAIVPATADEPLSGKSVVMFDGKSLAGWKAIPAKTSADWSVANGVIIGKGSANRQSYLVWKEANLTDFELRLKYRLLTKGNTGVEIRAQPDMTGKRPFQGYHADLGHIGIGKNILGAWDFHFAKRREYPCPRGTRLVIDTGGKAHSTAIPGGLALSDVRKRDWNDVRIIAEGTHFRFWINGKLASEFTDNAKRGRPDHGVVGLQLHDKGMHVEFKDLEIRRRSSRRSK